MSKLVMLVPTLVGCIYIIQVLYRLGRSLPTELAIGVYASMAVVALIPALILWGMYVDEQ